MTGRQLISAAPCFFQCFLNDVSKIYRFPFIKEHLEAQRSVGFFVFCLIVREKL